LVPVLFLSGENVSDQLVFKVFLPNGVRQLAEEKEEGQKVGQPEVVGGDGAIILGDISLIHVASGGSVSKARSDVRVPMYPAVQLGVGLELVEADDGLSVQVVLDSHEKEAEDYDERGGLMMELKHGGVRDHARVQEPPDQLVQERELVLDARRSH